jgi:hypothetical protein
MPIEPFDTEKPLMAQLRERNLELDQKLYRALEISASNPDIEPEDSGYPDSYLLLALYRMNTSLTRLAVLDTTRYNLFHEYLLAERCKPEEVVPGRRLCTVLNEAVRRFATNSSIGVGDFLRAIAHVSLHKRPEVYSGSTIHDTFSVETLLWGMGHSAWTAVEDAPNVRALLDRIERQEQVDDFQYILAVENDRIVFRLTSRLDDYGIPNDKGIIVPCRATLTHFKDQYGGFLIEEILELEDLINDRSAKEEQFQKFFEAHPHFLRVWDYREIFPHVYLTREELGPLVPDFILTDPQIQQARLVDLKLPSAKLIRHQENRIRFAAAITEARSQLLEYRDWFEDPTHRKAIQERIGLEIYRPRLAVVIGRSSEFIGPFERQKLSSREPDLEIVTYDDILTHARRRIITIQ